MTCAMPATGWIWQMGWSTSRWVASRIFRWFLTPRALAAPSGSHCTMRRADDTRTAGQKWARPRRRLLLLDSPATMANNCTPYMGRELWARNWSSCFVLARQNTPWITPVAWKLVASISLAQSIVGSCQGTVGEIGVHRGAGLGLLAAAADSQEEVWMADLFDQKSNLDRSGNANEVAAHDAVRQIAERSASTVLRMSSTMLRQHHVPNPPFRILHVDGSHLSAVALSDIHWAAAAISQSGVVIVDDVGHRRWLGPSRAVRAYLSLFSGYAALLPLAYVGLKLVLCRPQTHASLLAVLLRSHGKARRIGVGLRLRLESPDKVELSAKDPLCQPGSDPALVRAEPPCRLPQGNFSVAVLFEK